MRLVLVVVARCGQRCHRVERRVRPRRRRRRQRHQLRQARSLCKGCALKPPKVRNEIAYNGGSANHIGPESCMALRRQPGIYTSALSCCAPAKQTETSAKAGAPELRHLPPQAGEGKPSFEGQKPSSPPPLSPGHRRCPAGRGCPKGGRGHRRVQPRRFVLLCGQIARRKTFADSAADGTTSPAPGSAGPADDGGKRTRKHPHPPFGHLPPQAGEGKPSFEGQKPSSPPPLSPGHRRCPAGRGCPKGGRGCPQGGRGQRRGSTS